MDQMTGSSSPCPPTLLEPHQCRGILLRISPTGNLMSSSTHVVTTDPHALKQIAGPLHNNFTSPPRTCQTPVPSPAHSLGPPDLQNTGLLTKTKGEIGADSDAAVTPEPVGRREEASEGREVVSGVRGQRGEAKGVGIEALYADGRKKKDPQRGCQKDPQRSYQRGRQTGHLLSLPAGLEPKRSNIKNAHEHQILNLHVLTFLLQLFEFSINLDDVIACDW